ncbi:UNVERIFIED_CONTAM: hypothetical protein K2H54_073592 [Gekko kuhli]
MWALRAKYENLLESEWAKNYLRTLKQGKCTMRKYTEEFERYSVKAPGPILWLVLGSLLLQRRQTVTRGCLLTTGTPFSLGVPSGLALVRESHGFLLIIPQWVQAHSIGPSAARISKWLGQDYHSSQLHWATMTAKTDGCLLTFNIDSH